MDSKLFIKIKHLVGQAIAEFNLIETGDRVAVAVSGGKDSWTLLHMLAELHRRAPVPFELVALNVDSGYPGYRTDIIRTHLEAGGFAFHQETTNHFEVIQAKRAPGTSYCSFCARLRRGVLYTLCRRLGCNKLALGHHADDFIETLLLNQFFAGSLKAMSARMLADDGVTTVIRPLVYATEADIAAFAREQGFPIVCCACPVCGRADLKRQRMKTLLRQLEEELPGVRHSLLRALANVHPRHLLDSNLRGNESDGFDNTP